jgi:hypothetical protein
LTEVVTSKKQAVAFGQTHFEKVQDRRKELDTKRISHSTLASCQDRKSGEGVGEVDLADCFRTECQRMDLVVQNRLLQQVFDIFQSEGNA